MPAKNLKEYNKKYYRDNRSQLISRTNIHRIKRQYGMTIEQYEQMLADQNYVCKICGKHDTKRKLHIDHDHDSGKVRSLLCSRCNLGIGYFREDIVTMQKAIEYLKVHGK